MKILAARPRLPRRRRLLAGILTATLVAAFTAMVPVGATTQDEEKADSQKIGQGMGLYRAWCRSCHGEAARGDGPMAEYLRVPPSDLTLLRQNQGGRFDVDQVAAKIDGREEVAGHGSKDMPVWGDAFKVAEEFGGEAMVRAKIIALVHYLRSIQVAESATER